MIRVVHIVWSDGFGGILTLVNDLTTAQAKQKDLSVEIFLCKSPDNGNEHAFKFAVPCHYGNLQKGTDVSPAIIRNLTKLFKEYDILHFHSFNLATAIAAVNSGKKIFYTEHGNFGFGRKLSFGNKISRWMLKMFLHRMNFISFNSEFTQAYAEKIYHLKCNRAVIYNGTNSSPLIKTDDKLLLSIAEKTFVVGTSSRFVGFKRIDRLIEGFAKFSDGKDDVLLLLVGDGSLKNQFEEQVKSLGISTKTLFTGFRPNVKEYQNRMNVCVFPSENEPFGLVAVETLSLGKPTIIFDDGGGMTEIIARVGKADIVGSPAELSNRLDAYYSSRNSKDEEIEKRKEVSSHFTIEQMEEAIRGQYKLMLMN